MPTLRSINYYANSHGTCVKLSSCRFQHIISDVAYCQDNNGEYSDYCKCYIKPENLGSVAWIIGFHNWDELKQIVKKTRNASFMLPVVSVNGEYKLGDPSDYKDNTEGLKGVMYTTDERIKQKFGTRMEFYSYSFLRSIFEKELLELN